MSQTTTTAAVPAIAPTAPEPWWVKPALATLVILVFAGTLAGTAFIKNDTLQITLFTMSGGGFLTAIGFYFGGAASGARKDDTIATLAVKGAGAPLPDGTTTTTTSTVREPPAVAGTQGTNTP